jgi:hypothetical protein
VDRGIYLGSRDAIGVYPRLIGLKAMLSFQFKQGLVEKNVGRHAENEASSAGEAVAKSGGKGRGACPPTSLEGESPPMCTSEMESGCLYWVSNGPWEQVSGLLKSGVLRKPGRNI